MTKRIHHYRPQRTSPESLEAIFVAREHLLQEILGRLEQWQPKTSRQHFLLVGPRGIGKTHVLSLIDYRISKTPHLDKKWFSLLFPEESYGVTKIADLLLEALRILVEKTGDNEAAAVYKKVKYEDNDATVTDLTLDVFRKFHRDRGVGFLFLIENLNRLLERQIKAKTEVHLLRKILIEEDWLVTVCTSPTYLDAVIKEDEPFFEFFQLRFLAELSQEDQLEMFQKLADYDDNKDFQDYLHKYRSRLQALYHFTGGNPRLTVMLYDLVSHQAITEVQDELDRLLDKITPFYQDRMKDIGEQEGKLIETMALLGEGCTPKELAAEARMEDNIVRTVLGRLEKAGYVRRETRGQKKTVYIIPERLFRIWHQMNRSREGRGLIRYLLEFFSTWYQTKEERDEVWNEIIKKMQMGADGDEEIDEDLNEYKSYIIEISQELDERFEREFDQLRKLTLPRGTEAVEKELERLDSLYGTDGSYYIYKGNFYSKDLGLNGFALHAYQKATELRPDDVIPLYSQALILEILHRREEADALFLKVAMIIADRPGRINSFETLNVLLNFLRDAQDNYTVRIAAHILGRFANAKIADEIITILKHSREDWRRQFCITTLGFLNAPRVAALLLSYLSDEADNVRGSAATALGRIGSEKAVGPLIHTLSDKANDVRGSAATALGRVCSEKAVEPLIKALSDKANEVRGSAATALGRIGSKKAVEPLIDALSDKANNVRGSAATALGRIGSEKAVDPLIKVLNDKANDVRSSARIALVHIAAEGAISQLDKVINKIFEHLNDVEQEYLPSVTRNIFRAAFRSAELKIIGAALESAKKYLDLDELLYLPYEIAFEYIKSNANPAILDRQHPEMRDAVQLLIDLYQNGKTKLQPST
ncbi:MAG: HEAT repeat domain-containing protein [Candidatus Aminicenantes bacterium]|nr:HEAT repeat domain-containing protein [Candidatus Aminicenantes bacterium]